MNLSELQNNSYAPYSNRKAKAVVQSKSGAFFPGVRVENISFPLTISAAQNALFCCLSEGETPETIFLDTPACRESATLYWQEQYDCAVEDLQQLDDIEFTPVLKAVDDIPATLKALLDNALVKESDFPVSALLDTKDGFITGINIENTDWSRGLCAERVALAKAISYSVTDYEALHVCTRDGEYSSPCGACRQVILEHLPHHPVYLLHSDGTCARHFTSELLPYSFQSSSLQNKHK